MADISQRHLDGYIGTSIMLRELFYLEYKNTKDTKQHSVYSILAQRKSPQRGRGS